MKIIFNKEAYKKMFNYIDAVDTEISGFGKISITATGDILVEDVKIFKQTVSASETELSDEAIGNFLEELIALGEDPYNWKLWWHSHANMGVFWSGTDTATMSKLSANNDWQLSIVGNRKHELKCRVNIYKPFNYFQDDLKWEIENNTESIPQEIIDEVKEKVTQQTYPVYTGRFAYLMGHNENTFAGTYYPINKSTTTNKKASKTAPDYIMINGGIRKYAVKDNEEIVEAYCTELNIPSPLANTKKFFMLLREALETYGIDKSITVRGFYD